MRHRPLRVALLALIVLVIVVSPTAMIVLRATRGSAAFGDAEPVGRNRVAAATLDIAIGERTVPIRADGLAPGDSVAGTIDLVNAGTIPLRYSVSVSGTTSNGLGAWLTWSFAPAPERGCPSAETWATDPPPGALTVEGGRFTAGATVPLLDGRVLDVGEGELLCLTADFALGAPNAVQATTTELVFAVAAEQLAPGEMP